MKIVSKLTPSIFGPERKVADLELPKYCNVIIVCYNQGQGLIPVKVLLPHQLSEEYINEIWKTYVQDAYYGEITVIPAKAKHYITIAEQESIILSERLKQVKK